ARTGATDPYLVHLPDARAGLAGATCQSLVVPSWLAVASVLLSGEKATLLISSRCAGKVMRSFHVVVFQSFTIPSTWADASVLPSGETISAEIDAAFAGAARSLPVATSQTRKPGVPPPAVSKIWPSDANRRVLASCVMIGSTTRSLLVARSITLAPAGPAFPATSPQTASSLSSVDSASVSPAKLARGVVTPLLEDRSQTLTLLSAPAETSILPSRENWSWRTSAVCP